MINKIQKVDMQQMKKKKKKVLSTVKDITSLFFEKYVPTKKALKFGKNRQFASWVEPC